MAKLKTPVVVPDLTDVVIKNVTFHEVPTGVEHEQIVEPDGKKKLVAKLGKDGKTIPLPADRMILVKAQIIAEDGTHYPATAQTAALHFFDDRGTGSGGIADSLVLTNDGAAGFNNILAVKSEVAKPAVYDEVQKAYRTGKTDAEGCENVAKWLVKTGRVPG